MIFGKSWGEPRYGKNPGLVQRFAARPDEVELAGGALLPVPRAIATQLEGLGLAGLLHEPQRARRCQDQAQRVGSHDALDRAALILPPAREGVAIADRDFYGPAVAILRQDDCQGQREVGGEKRLDRRRWLAVAGLSATTHRPNFALRVDRRGVKRNGHSAPLSRGGSMDSLGKAGEE